ncbi:hypothetical protein [Amycolatopsis saalfeldensis]|uniref:Uncharacterized protein n=1 Tax=Amycolatopsis saalfeldensis TaxID=394193 RepID=A0A1H8YM07_9PSEU|nr:hypothetical protein [Amycolatopsis saalfeldensis]SEP52428.1 hypothetical protein SAMN04489732_12091 [Amycolatopsis saalfeldensis]
MGSPVSTLFDNPSRLAKKWRALIDAVVNHSVLVAVGLAGIVAAHAVSTVFWGWLNPYKSLAIDANTGTAVTLYLGAAAAAAIVAGFAGVVIVFTIGSEADRIQRFRVKSGKTLQVAWMAVVAEPFAATLLGVVAAMIQVTSGKHVAPWFFELGLAFLIHGALLLLKLLSEVVQIVHAQDRVAQVKKTEVPTSELFD